MLFRSDLWEAVALGITAENHKIEIFIHHNHSRGVAREALLRSIVVQHTPDPYKVRSGFVFTHDHRVAPSKQCDVLVYDPRIYQPYYQIEEFVVVSQNAASVIVEVKSDIGDREMCDLRNMTTYANSVLKPLLGFAYDGWLFDTFCEKIRLLANEITSLPVAIAVHEKNYLAIRPTSYSEPVCFLIDFSRSNPTSPGMATAYFMNVYALLLKNDPISDGTLQDWVRDVVTIVPPEAKKWLTPDGVLHDLTEILGPA